MVSHLIVMRKTNKSISDFWWLTPPASPASTHEGGGARDKKNSLSEPCAKVCQHMPQMSN